MLICKFKNKPKGWYQVSNINIELDTITYVDDYHNDLTPYAFTTTNLRYIQKIKQVKDSILFARNKKKKIDKFRKKLWRKNEQIY